MSGASASELVDDESTATKLASDRTLHMQALQNHLNGQVVLSLMKNVQARGKIVASGVNVQLNYPHIMAQMESKTESPYGGYVQSIVYSKKMLKGVSVFKWEQLPLFSEAKQYAQEKLEGAKLGAAGDGRLQLVVLEHHMKVMSAREATKKIVIDGTSAQQEGMATLLAQGEFDIPVALEKLKSFVIKTHAIVNIVSDSTIGPFSAQQIKRQFNSDCIERKSFFKSERAASTLRQEELPLFTCSNQVNLADSNGRRVSVRLVRHQDKTHVLGFAYSLDVALQGMQASVECALCLEECSSAECACPTCRNLLHHKCKQQMQTSGIQSCPFCREPFV